MAAFKLMHEVCNNFENYSRSVADELFCVKTPEPFEDIFAKKARDVQFFTSKLRLLLAKSWSDKQSVVEESRTAESTIREYGEAVSWKIIEQQVVKAVTQSHTVKTLVTTPNNALEPEYVEKKEKIIEQLSAYAREECRLRSLEAELRKNEEELLTAQQKWDETVGNLKDREDCDTSHNQDESGARLQIGLENLTEKTDLMRWLIGKLVTSRFDPDYDWLADPDQRFRALALARQRDIV